MGRRCVIPRCTTGTRSLVIDNKKRKVKNKTLFKAPKDIVAFQKWKEATACNNFQLSGNSYICEEHFRESDITRKYTHIVNDGDIVEIERELPVLQKGAVPCFFMNEKSANSKQRMSVCPEPVVTISAPESDEDTVDAETDNIVKWDFHKLIESYRSIKLPSDEWAAAFNKRRRFVQFTSVQDENLQRGLRIYHNMDVVILLDSRPVNLQSVRPPKSESDLIELLNMVSKLNVCRTAINKKKSPASQCWKFEECMIKEEYEL